MIEFKRYSHVGGLFKHYAEIHDRVNVMHLLNAGIKSREDAEVFCQFAVFVVDCIATDLEKGVVVLGGSDNTSAIPDIDYEVSLIMDEAGYGNVWDEVCDQS